MGAISSVNGLIALDAVSNKIEIKMKAVMFLKSNKKRPIVIDCANVACQYAYNANNLGDGLGLSTIDDNQKSSTAMLLDSSYSMIDEMMSVSFS